MGGISNEEIKDEFEKLKLGDIIWAKRYNKESTMLQIPKGHRKGPYIVIEKHDNKLKCLYGTSSLFKEEISNLEILELTDQKYPLANITYIYITKNFNIGKDRFVKKIGHLNIEDEKTLLKKIEIIQKSIVNTQIKFNVPELSLEPGDIIKNNHLIISEDEKHYHCIKLESDNKILDFYININNKKYYLNFFSIIKLKKDSLIFRENFIDNITLKKILGVLKRRMAEANKRIEISRGSLLRINGEKYYVYGEIGSEWQAFKIIGYKNKQLCRLIIDKKIFYTDFKECIQIPKKQVGIEIIGGATEYEMEDIKKRKKSYKKSNNSSKLISLHELETDEIQSGTIIKDINNNVTELYVVILKTENELVAMKYNDFLEGQYVLNKLFVNEVEKVGIIDNFDLKQILLDIQGNTDGFINKKRVKKIINSL